MLTAGLFLTPPSGGIPPRLRRKSFNAYGACLERALVAQEVLPCALAGEVRIWLPALLSSVPSLSALGFPPRLILGANAPVTSCPTAPVAVPV